MAKDHQICNECVYKFEVMNDTYSRGLIVCKVCNHWKTHKLYAVGGGYMEFACQGLDKDDLTIYIPAMTTARITEAKLPLKMIQCLNCLKELPNWFLFYNTYLQKYFKEQSHGKFLRSPTKNKTS